ncbi:MAG: hypothetical protein WCH43_11325, partial [Verrucomicrobiota bacterium]
MKKIITTFTLATALAASALQAEQIKASDGKQNVLQNQAPAPATDDQWQVSITPYAWIPTIDADVKLPVDTRVKRLNGELSVDQPWWKTVSDLFKGKVDVISGDGRIEFSKGKWGGFVDGYWIFSKATQEASSSHLRIDDQVDVIGSINVTSKMQIWQVNFGPRYLIGTRSLNQAGTATVGLELYGGGRINGISSNIKGSVTVNKFNEDFNKDNSRVFAEPMLGVKTIWAFGPNFTGIIRGDVGGFNVVENNTDCDLEAGIAWQFHKNTYFDLAYRARGVWQT